MKRIAYVILLLTVNIGYTFGQIQQDLAELKQDGLDEDGLGYLCISQGVRFYVTHTDGLFLGFIWEIRGDDGTIIKLPAQTEINILDDKTFEAIFAGRRMECPVDSIKSVCNIYRDWKKNTATPLYEYSYQHDAPIADEGSTDTDIHLYADFPIGSNVAYSHIRFWMSKQISGRIRYITEGLKNVNPVGCYFSNNDQSPKQMIDYYGDFYRDEYRKNIHHTISDFEYGGLSLDQGFELQAILPDFITYLYTDAVYAQGNTYGGQNCSYVSFDRKTGREIKAEDLFRSETMHKLKERILHELYRVISKRDVKLYDRSYSDIMDFLVGSDMITYLGGDENTPIENVIDNIPVEHVALLEEGLIITYLPNEIESFGAGPTWILLPYSEIKEFMKPYQSGAPLPGGNLTITSDSLNRMVQHAYLLANEGEREDGLKTMKMVNQWAAQLEGKENEAYNYWQWQYFVYCVNNDEVSEAEGLMKEMLRQDAWSMESYSIYDKMILLYAKRRDYEKVLELLPKSSLGAHGYAYYNYLAGDLDKAVEYAKGYIKNMLSNKSSEFKNLIGEERDRAWSEDSYWYAEFLPMLAYRTQDEMLLKGAYDALLLGKGILLNAETSFQQHILKSGDKEGIYLFNEMQKAKEQLQAERMLTSEHNNNEPIIEELEDQIKILEEQLIGRSKRYGDFTRQMQISALDVCLNMSPTETAIEFASVSQNDSTHYLAFILNGESAVPKAVYVCNGDELSNCIKNGIPDLAQLYHCVWERIEKEVELKEIISFSPSGQLHNLGIEYAQLPDGRLFSDAHTVCRYSSTREIVLKRDPSYREPFSYDIGGVALFGGIDYETAENTKNRGDGEYVNNNKEVKENIRRGALALDVSSFAYLPQTKTEIEQISDILKQAPNQPKIDIYEGSRGTENAFKDISGRKMFLIHTATHGFYFSGDDLDDDTGIGQYFSTYRKNAKTQEEMALSCSGLLLAGANQILNSGSAENLTDDGILTASEISTLDLSTVNMVVLSACQTACGELSGDGVFGLQRGFKKAGAKTLLMSLWQVDDRATRILMVEFYKNLLKISDNWTALKDAINYLRTTENGRYASPEYWAAFILLD